MLYGQFSYNKAARVLASTKKMSGTSGVCLQLSTSQRPEADDCQTRFGRKAVPIGNILFLSKDLLVN